jgi:hypothetical protein
VRGITTVIAAFVLSAITTSSNAWAQYYQPPPGTIDPLVLENELIRRSMEHNAIRRRNETMRLELERLDLEEQLRYRRMSDFQVSGELGRYCPTGEPPCHPPPPPSLVQEAVRRGLIEFKTTQPSFECLTLSSPDGSDAITNCH